MNLELENELAQLVRRSVELDSSPGKREEKLLSISESFQLMQQNLGGDIGIYFKDIIIALLNCKFSISKKHTRFYNEIIYFISDEKRLEIETNFLTRLILSLESIAALSDVILGPANRLQGFETAFSLFAKRPILQFLRLVQADTIEILLLLTIIEYSI